MAPFDLAASADVAAAGMIAAPGMGECAFAPRAIFAVECVGADGEVKWREDFHNTVFTAGKVDILEKYFRGSAYTAAWFLALKGTGTEVAADTLASHASWAEVTGVYAAANRPTVSFAAAAANGANGQIATSAAVSIAITGSGTVAGCGLTQTQVKATTTGILYNAGDFAAPRTVASGDTLNVSLTLTIT
jgi:hypothetical protein